MANYNSRHTGAEIDNCVDNYQSAAQVTAAITAAKLAMFPVGSVYITINDNNPALFIGGIWERIGQGRTLVGVGTGTDDNSLQEEFQPNESGGEYMHALSETEIPQHWHDIKLHANGTDKPATHTFGYSNWGVGGGSNIGFQWGNYIIRAEGGSPGNGAHNNMSPYLTVFFWQRTA